MVDDKKAAQDCQDNSPPKRRMKLGGKYGRRRMVQLREAGDQDDDAVDQKDDSNEKPYWQHSAVLSMTLAKPVGRGPAFTVLTLWIFLHKSSLRSVHEIATQTMWVAHIWLLFAMCAIFSARIHRETRDVCASLRVSFHP
jgi:hypothetical protein